MARQLRGWAAKESRKKNIKWFNSWNSCKLEALIKQKCLKGVTKIRFLFDQIFPKNKKTKLCAYSMNNKFHI